MNIYLITVKNSDGTQFNLIQKAKSIGIACATALDSDIIDSSMTEFHVMSVSTLDAAKRKKGIKIPVNVINS